ncbi:hypothetical protein ACPCKW_22535 [Streptomyces griseoincarnatus]
MRTVPLAWMYEIGDRVVVTARSPAYGTPGVIVGYGADYGYDTDYTVQMDCFECSQPCRGGWNHASLTREGGGPGPDDVLPPPVDPGGTIPIDEEVALAA